MPRIVGLLLDEMDHLRHSRNQSRCYSERGRYVRNLTLGGVTGCESRWFNSAMIEAFHCG